jgi:hypothetical protein
VIAERAIDGGRRFRPLDDVARLAEVVVDEHGAPAEQNPHPEDRCRETVERGVARIERDRVLNGGEGFSVIEIVGKLPPSQPKRLRPRNCGRTAGVRSLRSRIPVRRRDAKDDREAKSDTVSAHATLAH